MNRLGNAERTPRKGSVASAMDEETAAALPATITKSGRKVKRPLHLASPDRTLAEAGRGSPAKSAGRKLTKTSVNDDREKAAPGTPIKQSVSSDVQTVGGKSSSRKTLTRKTLASANSEVATPKKGNEIPLAEDSGVSKSGRKIKVPAKLTDYESSLLGSPRKSAAAPNTDERDAVKTPARAIRSAKKQTVQSESSANKVVVERATARKTNVVDAAAAESEGDHHGQSSATPTKTRGRRARSVAPVKSIPDEPFSEKERLLKTPGTPGRRLLGISMIDIGSTIEPQQTKQRKRATTVGTKENESVEPASVAKKPGRKAAAAARTLVSDVLSNTSKSDGGTTNAEGEKPSEVGQAGAQESDVHEQEAQKDLTEVEKPTANVQPSNKTRGPTIVESEVSTECSPVSVSPEGQGFSRSGRKIKPKKIFGAEDGGGDKSIIVSTAARSKTPTNPFVTRRTIDDHHHASKAKITPSVAAEPDEPDRAVPLVVVSTPSSTVRESIGVPPGSSRSGRVIKPKKFFDDGSITEKKKPLAVTPTRRAKEEGSEATVKITAKQSPIVADNSTVLNVNVPSLDGVDVAEGFLPEEGSSNVILEDDATANKQDDTEADSRNSSGEALNKSIPSDTFQDGNEIEDAMLPSASTSLSPSAADNPVEERAESDPAEANEVLHTDDVKPGADGAESTHMDDTNTIEKQSPVAIVGPSETSIIVIPDTPATVHGRQLSDTFSPEKPMLPNERIPHIAPEITITGSPTAATDSRTVATPRTPRQTNEYSPDKPPEVIEIFDSPATVAFCQQMISGNSTSSTPLLVANTVENIPASHRKRSMSTSAAEAKKRNVTFHSPANVTVLVDTIDELMQKKVVRRKRSLSEHAPGAAVGADDGVKPNKISRIPNFKSIHEKNFKRMESIGDFMKRKEKRAQMIMTAASPATKLLAQGVSSTATATTAPTDGKHIQARIEKKPERLFTFKSGGSGSSAAATSLIKKGDVANQKTVAQALFNRRPLTSSLKRPIAGTEQRLANRQMMYKTAPLAGIATSSTTVAAGPASTAGLSTATVLPVDQLRKKQSTILKGVRTNRRFELQMKHRDNLH